MCKKQYTLYILQVYLVIFDISFGFKVHLVSISKHILVEFVIFGTNFGDIFYQMLELRGGKKDQQKETIGSLYSKDY